jgi:DNA polymerase-1
MRSTYLKAPTGQLSLGEMTSEVREIDAIRILDAILPSHQLVFHTEQFDHRALYRISEAEPTDTHDITHLARLLEWQEERTLRWLHKKYVKKPPGEGYVDLKKKRGKLADIPVETVAKYARKDAVDTLETFEVIHPRVYGITVSEDYYERDRKYARLVMKLIRRGLKLDKKWCQKRTGQFRDRMVEIQEDLRAQGLRDIASNPSVASFLFKHLDLPADTAPLTTVRSAAFPTGVPSVAEPVIESIKHMHPAAALILEWRQLSGAISKWLDQYQYHAMIDGRVHALLDPFGTVTARIAASEPNVTAIPMEDRGTAFGSMKGIFTGDQSNHKLWSVDYSQAEARLAAVMAREPRLLSLFNSGQDPYPQMADDLWGDPERRSKAKHAYLASIYGVGTEKFATEYNLEWEEAELTLRLFRRAFPRIQTATGLAEGVAKREGCIRTWNGRPRWFSPDFEDEYKAFNQKVQMSVAEIIKEAMLAVEDIFPGMLRLQIHDSLVLNIPNSWRTHTGSNIAYEVAEIMEEVVPEQFTERVAFPAKKELWQ